MPTKVKVNFSSAEKILKAHGFQRGGQVQQKFTSEVKRISVPYVPKDEAGILMKSASNGEFDESIIYSTPYARYHWYGKLMVSPSTGLPFAKLNEHKVMAEPERMMQYQGAPLRGPKWVERAWIDHGQEVVRKIQHFVDTGGKTIE